tara:strand:+ start:1374 stop:2078 length:705 start_codon:yes stop_codon:yes gene_type:complete
MNALDKLVIQKRLDCDDDCSYVLRQKKYRQQRKNLGELNRLRSSQPRPIINVEGNSWRGHDNWFEKLMEEDEVSSSGWSSQDDEWFELSKKRMFDEADTGYIKRLRTANVEELEQERQAKYDNWEAFREQFLKDWREDRERAEKQESRKSIRDALNEYTQLKERRIAQQNTSNIQGSLAEYREERIRQMEEEIASYRQYRNNTNNNNSVIREAMDEYYGQMRENVGELERLREP